MATLLSLRLRLTSSLKDDFSHGSKTQLLSPFVLKPDLPGGDASVCVVDMLGSCSERCRAQVTLRGAMSLDYVIPGLQRFKLYV